MCIRDSLEMDFVFDNSEANAVNPNPNEFVMWGDQTYEEMAVAFFQVSEPRAGEEATTESAAADTDEVAKKIQPEVALPGPSEAVKAKIVAAADKMLAEFDKDEDGEVAKSETPWVFRRYQFRDIDQDNDAVLTRKEIEEAASWRIR